MQLPQPKVPTKPKATVPLPTPRLPGGAKAAAVQPPKAPSRTQDLRAASLASLTITGPTRAPRVGGGQARPRRDRSPSKPVGNNDSAFGDGAWRSSRPIERRGTTFEVVVRVPNALEVAGTRGARSPTRRSS